MNNDPVGNSQINQGNKSIKSLETFYDYLSS